jgi:hypothetical protein
MFAQNVPEPKPKLLSTAALACEIHSLEWPTQDIEPGTPAFRARVSKARSLIGNFITRQIDAYPAISERDLEKQILRAFSLQQYECELIEDDMHGAPRVFTSQGTAKTPERLFVVIYTFSQSYGMKGSETILESYVWEQERGVHRSAGTIAPRLSDMLTKTAQIGWWNDSEAYWVLVWGTVGGASGRVLSGAATVYELAADHIKPVWSTPDGVGNVEAYAHRVSGRWEVEYTDPARRYNDLPKSSYLEIFQIDSAKRAYRRLVHQPLD